MKSFFAVTVLAALAGNVLAAPTAEKAQSLQEREEAGLFDGFFGGNSKGTDDGGVFSDIFDGAACVVSGFIGGGNPKCRGEGEATITKPPGTSTSTSSNSNGDSDDSDDDASSNVKDTGYKYNYTTTDDGKLQIKITPNDSSIKPCTKSYEGKGADLKKLVAKTADECVGN